MRKQTNKTIRLTESDLYRIVRRVIKEQDGSENSFKVVGRETINGKQTILYKKEFQDESGRNFVHFAFKYGESELFRFYSNGNSIVNYNYRDFMLNFKIKDTFVYNDTVDEIIDFAKENKITLKIPKNPNT